MDLRQGRAAQGMAEKRQRASMGGQALPSVIFFQTNSLALVLLPRAEGLFCLQLSLDWSLGSFPGIFFF